ncbi:MAG TPA: hypothetical protein VGZ26_09420 [Pirellulales bacterium]|jgi:outer membrane lipoprotein-sorting protein|nr:hypothetical protein [Pirellulales bacterium]
MTTDDSLDPSDLITRVVDAFERVHVPAGPSVQEAIELLERAAGEDDSHGASPYPPGKNFVGAWNRLAWKCKQLTVKQCIAAGGVGLSTVVGLTLLMVALNSPGQLSAMERMAKQLRGLKSYSYKMSEHVTIVQKGKDQPGIVELTVMNYWRAPGSFREEMKIVVEGAVPPGYRKGRIVDDVIIISLTDKPGIVIDRTSKSFIPVPELRASETGSGSLMYPFPLLRIIREETGEVTRDLGTKEIQGKKARGYLMVFKKQGPDPVEIWLDPQTDLPMEFGCEAKSASTTNVMRVTDCHWDIDLDPKLFQPTPPEGYTDITPPTDEKQLAQIAAALKLYAQLSGGHYPPIDTFSEKFDGDAIGDEMLKLAGVTGSPQAQWKSNKKFQDIQQAAAGLDWIAKIVRDKNNTGYHGLKVGPQDNDKVLLWWTLSDPPRYRVFYGDLRTTILTEEEGQKVIPHRPKLFGDLPEDDQNPNEKQ